MLLSRLGDAVVRARVIGNLTQEEVAELAGISVYFLRKVERGTGNPSYLTLRTIAKALDVELDVLIREAR